MTSCHRFDKQRLVLTIRASFNNARPMCLRWFCATLVIFTIVISVANITNAILSGIALVIYDRPAFIKYQVWLWVVLIFGGERVPCASPMLHTDCETQASRQSSRHTVPPACHRAPSQPARRTPRPTRARPQQGDPGQLCLRLVAPTTKSQP